jgi:hypothetical protein
MICLLPLDENLTSVKSDAAESSAKGVCGPVESYTGRILVEDASGARFYVHEYRGRRTFLHARRYMLDTGEPVRRIDSKFFAIVATGEKLMRVDGD